MPEKYFEYTEIGDALHVWWWDSPKQAYFEKRLEGEALEKMREFTIKQKSREQDFMAAIVTI